MDGEMHKNMNQQRKMLVQKNSKANKKIIKNKTQKKPTVKKMTKAKKGN
tara:strand:+ start:1944 stop:2090 length:147 start_codon:yes stop_codon:yes gene_type:complete